MKVPLLLFVILLLFQASTQHAINPRISNGRPTRIDEFKFMASIKIRYSFTSYIHLCQGVVIDEFWVLSTRICVRATTVRIATYTVKIGMYYIKKDHPAVQTRKIAERFMYNYTDRRYKHYNIGLLKLDEKIANAVVVKISQPESYPTGKLLMLGWGQITAGIFGRPPLVLQQGNVTIIPKDECKRLLSSRKVPEQFHDTQICAHSPEEGIAPCTGDTGAPMIRYVDNEPEVVAFVIWTVALCSKDGRPSVGTFIAPFIEWINEKKRMSANPITENDIVERDDLTTPLLEAY